MSLEVIALSVDIDKRRIIDNVSLCVPSGRFVGLLGPNGSGKSTLLKTLYRLRRPTSGQVLLDGRDLLAMSPRAASLRLAVVAQESSAEFDFTVHELVIAGRVPHKTIFAADDADDHEAVSVALARVGCTELAPRSFATLSGGEKQRVLIARAIAQGADHLVLDEPTNHLDIRFQLQILELVAELGITVLAALHDLTLAAMFCDEVYILANGRIAAAGRPSDVITAEVVRDVYGAEVMVFDHPHQSHAYVVPVRRSDPSTH